jgi:hypothetical protein
MKETVYGTSHNNADTVGLHKIANSSKDGFAICLYFYTPPHAGTRGFHLYDGMSRRQDTISKQGSTRTKREAGKDRAWTLQMLKK